MLLCDIVMVLMKKVGMFSYVGTAAEILGNKKYADFNAFTLIKGLKLPLMLRSYNGAMWMIQFLYIGNILTYTIKWIQHRIKGMRFAVVYLVVSVMAYLYDPLVFVTFIGNAGYFYRDYFTKVKSKNPEMSFFSTLGLMYLAQKAPAFSSVIPYYICESIVCGLLCLCSVQLLESITLLKKMIDFLGKYNMVIYSIHIPIIYSLGAFIFCTFYRYGFEAAFVSTYIVCLIAFLVIAIPYNIFIENNRLSLLSRFKGVLRI